MAQQPPVGQSLPIIEVLRSHSDKPHFVGLLWTSDQPVKERNLSNNTQHSPTQTPTIPVRFEPTFSADERLQTHNLERAATETGKESVNSMQKS